MNTQRILGLVGMLTSPFFLVYVLTSDPQESYTLLGALFGLVFQLGCLSSVSGLFAVRATGNGIGGRTVLVVQMILHTLAALFQILEYRQIGVDNILFTITDIAWPLGFLFMLVTGGAVIRARRWLGWRRFLPILCAVPLPVAMFSRPLGGEQLVGMIFGIGLFAIYGLLGLAVFTDEENASPALVTQPSF